MIKSYLSDCAAISSFLEHEDNRLHWTTTIKHGQRDGSSLKLPWSITLAMRISHSQPSNSSMKPLNKISHNELVMHVRNDWGQAPCGQTSVPLALYGWSLEQETRQKSQLNICTAIKALTHPITRKKQRSKPLNQIPKEGLCGKTSTAVISSTFSGTICLKAGSPSVRLAFLGKGGGGRILKGVLKAQTMQSPGQGILYPLVNVFALTRREFLG